ncbi:hypothetical protein PSN45_004920 [Yamadazyma tenuis]|uniref:FAD/NAD(P)-binding domain-containing protein n=1 Tax=Candida tenuis (strain ATCC 10573 / BCRC 21748 / CBS 615 / JCM 9827 / NBRC 10315 / NRRL Y-1498 / VKM Y-70) TaxID=590646 RepID=G3B246_CANTC|nr:FAD/NAD(P)-binding domain-containing protein [Yamadazyma tenuis ATCC 10573]XP_006685850.1 uncharacterized protein CANTEDRAFT_113373 [Yamadazyma tenuis ATCC 10573]EGV65043.1 FAD/NAD(P)-binding domain-containing protein [Yamadazyma tenuis ATCC 10573]EGV65044.1 hypothetical protein CANTEDRAFT_113373 [Yamadazyma tenuis ATCC 10573]WEJ97369.1 hypothetical protein PSN45_004920 [Yamadazyma tenuis]
MSTVVIIGSSFAGLAIARIFAKLDNSFKITFISPSDKFYPVPLTPKLAVDTSHVILEEINSTILKDSPAKFIKGLVLEIDPSKNQVITTAEEKIVKYDYLFIASGTKTNNHAFKCYDSLDKSVAALKAIEEGLATAKKVAVIGGGPTGIEMAAEAIDRFSDLKVDLYTGTEHPAMFFGQRRRLGTETKLATIGVNVINGKYVKEFSTTSLVVDGKTVDYDLVIDCTGGKPNSEFIPAELLDDKGRLITNEYFQTKYDNIYGFGDIVAITPNTISELVIYSAKTLKSVIQVDILKQKTKKIPYGNKKGTLVIMIPITNRMGVGEAFGFPIPSWIIAWYKGKGTTEEKAHHLLGFFDRLP